MIHHNLEEFTLNFIYIFPKWRAGEAAEQHDREPGTREEDLARAGGESGGVRISVWDD